MTDGEGLEPRFRCLRFDMVETICKRWCSSFYFPKDAFDGIPIPVRNHLESIAIFVKDSYQVVGIINEKFDIIELVLAVQLGKKPSRYLFRCRRKQPELQYFVCLRIDSTTQPVVVAVDADHFLVNRELIRTYRRNRL